MRHSLGEYGLLATDGCGYQKPSTQGGRPDISCAATAIALPPFIVAPHTSAKLATVDVYKGLDGMSSLRPGTYVWNREISWHYGGASEVQKARVAITYVIAQV